MILQGLLFPLVVTLAVVLGVALVAFLRLFAPLAISIAGATLWARWQDFIRLLYRNKRNLKPLIALWLTLTPVDLTTSLLPDADTLTYQTPFRSARSSHINEIRQLVTAVHILEYAVTQLPSVLANVVQYWPPVVAVGTKEGKPRKRARHTSIVEMKKTAVLQRENVGSPRK